MLINTDIYNRIINELPCVPPECGGILGGKNGIVQVVEFDLGEKNVESAVYTPDVNHLNSVIEEWATHGVDFLGLFHSHPNDYTLSDFDKEQIRCIMHSLSGFVRMLLFPIVIPGKCIYCYSAELCDDGEVIIKSDNIIIIEKEVIK